MTITKLSDGFGNGVQEAELRVCFQYFYKDDFVVAPGVDDARIMLLAGIPQARRTSCHRTSVVDTSLGNLSYETRLQKYASRGFAIGVPGLKEMSLDLPMFSCHQTPKTAC